ncbi:MAG: phosphoribosylanthranilate isomerase [Sphingomonadaceae bacterium]|nr:phosphoribosylanthranilate isomerase [Sphingomonadaceae bacterium]
MAVQTKICGVTTPEAVQAAIAGGATHIGLVFFAKSPRNITLESARNLTTSLPSFLKIVALVVDPEHIFIDEVKAYLPKLDAVQFHGEETPELIARFKSPGLELWKAVPIRSEADVKGAENYVGAADRILYDAKPPKGAHLPGGSGLRFDWSLLRGIRHPLPWVLAGGLDAQNVAEAHRVTGADFFDVSSGVEATPGLKDVDKISAFLKATNNL